MARHIAKAEAKKLATPIPGGLPFELVDKRALNAAVRGKYLVLEGSTHEEICVIGDVANVRELNGRHRYGFDCRTPDGTAYHGIVTKNYTIFAQMR